MSDEIVLKPVGWVRSPIKSLEDAPHWHAEGPEAELEILAEYTPALDGIRPGQRISLLTWLHRADRFVLHRQKRREPNEAPRGVFCSRSPARPNPIGLHEVTVLAVKRGAGNARLRVNALEALDGTPIVDIKTSREHFLGDDDTALRHAREGLAALCRRAAAKGLLPGLSGNASLRLGQIALLTPGGLPKENLAPGDMAPLDIASGRSAAPGPKASSESALHLEIYKNQPDAAAILHTHPAALTALGLAQPGKSFYERLDLPLFECAALREKIAAVQRLAPGGAELARAAGLAAREKRIIWLEGHGLCVWGQSADEALALSEECEHLARIAVMIL